VNRAHIRCSAGAGRPPNMAAPGPHALLGNAAALVSTGGLIVAALTLRQAKFTTCCADGDECARRSSL